MSDRGEYVQNVVHPMIAVAIPLVFMVLVGEVLRDAAGFVIPRAAYLFFLGSTGREQEGYGVDSSDSRFGSTILNSRSRPVSGKEGTLLIVYSGDIEGSLLPCG